MTTTEQVISLLLWLNFADKDGDQKKEKFTEPRSSFVGLWSWWRKFWSDKNSFSPLVGYR